jgi:7-cyano-7-deazaguanine synthase in queuosine biosynthesis
VVEGQMDVIALDQAGIAEAVAPLGTAMTERSWSCFGGCRRRRSSASTATRPGRKPRSAGRCGRCRMSVLRDR